CLALRLGLRARRVSYEAHNIWEDEGDASFVRSVTGGDETVPTVALGDQALVNPTVRQVRRLLETHAPQVMAPRRSRGCRRSQT
ncbi:MAG TPA: hypothetical protein VE152_03265, partial [Acidimicrobiales bacterium]|nr:hypothetical protein [Acidimicrobiales bacterium]